MSDELQKGISASVVLYGGAKEAMRCIKSLCENTKAQPFSLYVVDNASPDGALKSLEEMGLPHCAVALPQRENLGFGKGHNAVLPFLTSRYHAVVNPDIEVDGDVLSAMADYMDTFADVAITCPALFFPGGKQQHIAKRRPAFLPLLSRQLPLPFLQKYQRHYLMLDEDLTKPIDVEFCSGSFFLIRTDIFKEMGGFDEKYFMYVEDADITQKALKYGRAVFLPQVKVTHAWHRDAHTKPRQFWWQVKSMFRFFKKWGFKWQ